MFGSHGFRLCLVASVLPIAAAQATPTGGVYYETFSTSIVAIDLSAPSSGLGLRSGSFTNVAVGGDQVYFQEGRQIFRANADLSGATLFHTNGVAPTDIAINVSGNVMYESFGSQIVALDLATPSLGRGLKFGTAITNIAVADGLVYFQDGRNIFRANADLSGAALFHTNGVAPVDFDVDAANNVYYESFGSQIVAIDLANPSSLLGLRTGTGLSNIMVGDGFVYFQEGKNIFRGNRDLSVVTLFHNNGVAPTDIALLAPVVEPPVSDVPEPSSFALLGLAGLCLRLLRRQSPARAA